MIGQTISHYEILKQLGEGGMGVVFKARDTRLDRFVAVKVLSADKVADKRRKKRFIQEAKAASALNHPNIITIYEIQSLPDGADLIVMEFIEGDTLRTLPNQPVAVATAVKIGRQVAEALAVAHAAGIVHRDIKPENIMVRRDGYVKVLDFGLALLVRDSASHTESRSWRTHPGAILGTLGYMSPEQTRGETPGGAADVFSLGLVLYELVAGRHPFPGRSSIDVCQAILTEPALPLSRLRPEVPAPLEQLILRMIEKDPGDRPTAAEVAAALTAPESQAAEAAPRPAGATPERHTVGHQQQRTELRSAFESACAGRGLLVCLSGEPGIGKTTLVDDFLAEIAGRRTWAGRGRCSERLAGAEAYLPLLEVLESLIQGSSGAQLARIMKAVAPTWYFQIAPQFEDSATERLSTQAKGASQERMKRELHVFLQEVCRLRPLVLFLDDLQWADLSTVDVLAYLGDRISSMKMLILATYRPTDLLLSKHPFLQVKLEMQTRGGCREIPLDLLSREDIEKYLALSLPGHRFPADFVGMIHGRTEGNPLFMTDLLRYLRDRGDIVQDRPGGSWTLRESVSAIAGGVPESVRSMVQRKVDRLAVEDRRLLVVASVQGYEFDSAVVSKALETDAGEVEERLEALDRVHGLVRLLRELELPDRTPTLRYQFVHVLYHNAFYDSLRPTRRAASSAAVAQALLSFYGEQNAAVASQLAFLFDTARDTSKAVDYFLLAAQQAAKVSANQEALVLARRGLALLSALPDTPDSIKREIPLQIAVGMSSAALRGYAAPEAEEAFSRARALCLPSGESLELFTALFGVGAFYFFVSQQQTHLEIARQCVRLAEGAQNPPMQVLAHFMAANGFCATGDPVSGLQHAERCLHFYDPRQHSLYVSMAGMDPGLMGGGQASRLLWLCGYPDRAQAQSHETLGLARKLSHPYSLVFALFFAAWVHRYRREPQLTQKLADEAISVATEQGFSLVRAWASTLRGWALAEQGVLDEGLTDMRDSLTTRQSLGSQLCHTEFLAMLAEALARSEHVEDGVVTLDEAISLAKSSGERYFESEIYRLKGELLLQLSSSCSTEAEKLLRQAIDVAQKQSAKSFELRAASSLSRLLYQQGRAEEARQALRGIGGWFTEGFDTPDLQEAKELLERA